VIVPVTQDKKVIDFSLNIQKEFKDAGVRVEVDDREYKTTGWKFNEWELKGVPLRIEIGQQELKDGVLTVYRRDTNEKLKIKNEKIQLKIKKLLEEIQKNLFDKMVKLREENTHDVNDYEEFKKIMAGPRGFIRAFWCQDPSCEAKIKEETKASTRVLPLDAKDEKGVCIYCGKPSTHRWYFALAY